ncbi:tryptophan synthase subunit alpha [Microlunatus sp. Y2014]|uniref:tryptophan synthase subunit alpha n=1 Tax=Microlunatus sp. Y2014 TaxID=3418488 RepID=UPI003DA7728B
MSTNTDPNPNTSATAFSRARDQGRGAFVAYLPVGYPDVDTSYRAMETVAEHADLIEVGMPYSDPVMDGVTVQRATTRALHRGVRVRDLFGAVERVAATGTPAVSMIYWNLVERYGVDAFARDLAAAGGSGLITPDLTPDEADAWIAASDAHGLDRIFLVSPSSTDERLAMTLEACRGWVYATALMGVTGTRTNVSSMAPELVARIRATSPDTLVGVGLGVADGDQAAEVAGFADGVIVGSALVKQLLAAEAAGNPDDLSGLAELAAELAAGVRRADREQFGARQG